MLDEDQLEYKHWYDKKKKRWRRQPLWYYKARDLSDEERRRARSKTFHRITSYNVCYTKLLRVGIGIYAVKKLLFKKNPDGTSSRVAPSIKDTVIDRQNLTISASDAALYANTLYGAMLDFGTDEKVIYSTIDNIQSKDDSYNFV